MDRAKFRVSTCTRGPVENWASDIPCSVHELWASYTQTLVIVSPRLYGQECSTALWVVWIGAYGPKELLAMAIGIIIASRVAERVAGRGLELGSEYRCR